MNWQAVALIVVFIWLYKLGKRVSDLENKIERTGPTDAAEEPPPETVAATPLDSSVEELERLKKWEKMKEREVATTDPELHPDLIAQSLPAPSRVVDRPAPIHAARRAPKRPVREPSELQERWSRLERQLIENWTGILGAVVLVAGITFIGGYTGFRLSPFYRTLMIVAAAGALVAGSLFLDRRENWKPLAQWLRSSGAAVFLFACFASSAIPGLAWITALGPALGLLLLGVAANIYVAYAAGTQTFASLHVVLSLVPLTLIPQSDLSLVLATLVTAAGLLIAYRARWDLHSLITVAAYAVFHVAWYDRTLALTPDNGRVVGALSALLVGSMVALTHYRKTYASPGFRTLPFLVHLAGWVMLGTALTVYAGNTPLRGVTLIGAAAIVFFLARRGRTLGIRWIYLTDTLVAQALALVGVVSFYPFVFHWLLVPAVLFLQTALYLKISIDEDEELLERIGIHLLHAAALVLAVAGLLAIGPDRAINNQNAVLLLVSALLGAWIHLYLVKRRGESFDSLLLYNVSDPDRFERLSLLGSGVGVITAVALVNLYGGLWMETAAFAATTIFVILSRRSGSEALGAAAWITLVSAGLSSWLYLFTEHPVPPGNQLLYHLVPLLLAGAVAIAYAPERVGRFLRHSAIYLVGFTVAIAAYTLLEPISSLAPGIVWLSLSLVTLEVANRVQRDHIAPVLHIGYSYLAFFAGAYVLVVLQVQGYWGPVPVRSLIEGFAFAVAGYWWLYRPTTSLAEHRSWRAVHPLFLEMALAFLAVIVVVEVAAQWRPVAWGALAIVAVAKPVADTLDARFRFYSLLFYWASVLDLVIVTSSFATPSPLWYEHPGFTGGLAIVLQVLYLASGSRRLALAEIEFPPRLALLSAWCRTIVARQPFWLYYPFFIGGALFLYWRFEAAFLTLLWSAEAFVVFALSLVIRESHFRYMALAALAVCFVRLLVFDMAQANLGLRGVVFVGVGSLMLGMNALYNKYKDRFA